MMHQVHLHHIGIIYCTEIRINNWQLNCFSKKKACQKLKYQVVININTYQVLNKKIAQFRIRIEKMKSFKSLLLW
jgi:hypothetical protein